MIAVRVMHVPLYHVIRVISVGNSRMTAGWPVDMILGVLPAVVVRSTACRVCRADREHVLVDMIAVQVMQMPVVQVVDVVAVTVDQWRDDLERIRDIGVTHVIFGSDIPPPLDAQLRVLAELRQHLR